MSAHDAEVERLAEEVADAVYAWLPQGPLWSPDAMRALAENAAREVLATDAVHAVLAAQAPAPTTDAATVLSDLRAWATEERERCLRALHAHPANHGGRTTSDYWRWQGHAERLRQLLERLPAAGVSR